MRMQSLCTHACSGSRSARGSRQIAQPGVGVQLVLQLRVRRVADGAPRCGGAHRARRDAGRELRLADAVGESVASGAGGALGGGGACSAGARELTGRSAEVLASPALGRDVAPAVGLEQMVSGNALGACSGRSAGLAEVGAC